MRTNRRRMKFSNYEKIEYIESNGSSYIDTGIYGSDSLNIEISIALNKEMPSVFFLASRLYATERTYALVYDSGFSHIRFDYNNTLNILSNFIDKITIRKSGLNVFVNNVWKLRVYEGKFTTPSTLLLFGILQNGIVHIAPTGGKLYFLKMTENGVLVRDFVPVKRKSDGVIGMYDTIGGKFYTSPNGVSFTGGRQLITKNIL